MLFSPWTKNPPLQRQHAHQLVFSASHLFDHLSEPSRAKRIAPHLRIISQLRPFCQMSIPHTCWKAQVQLNPHREARLRVCSQPFSSLCKTQRFLLASLHQSFQTNFQSDLSSPSPLAYVIGLVVGFIQSPDTTLHNLDDLCSNLDLRPQNSRDPIVSDLATESQTTNPLKRFLADHSSKFGEDTFRIIALEIRIMVDVKRIELIN